MIKCPLCQTAFKEIEDLYLHVDKKHGELIPEGWTASRYLYFLRTKREHGNCVVCKKPTGWNNNTNKYHRFCTNPKCKEEYRKIFEERMIGKHGKISLLDDPEHQKKMLSNRSISGTYKWSDGGETTYTGSYELDFLRMLDNLLDFEAVDIMAPSPHTYWYVHEGVRRFYIPDFYIPSLNLEVEIKDGGDNPNNHYKIQAVDKVKEKLKDEVMTSQDKVSYIKVVNKEYGTFFTFLNKAKKNFINGFKEKPIFLLENVANMAPIVSPRTNDVEYSNIDDILEESGGRFTLRNIDLIMSNMMKNCRETGNFEAIRPNLLKLVERANTLEDIKYLRQDAYNAPHSFKMIVKNRPELEEKCKDQIQWINDVYKPALNRRAKEIRNTIVAESTVKFNEEDLMDHHGIAAVIVDSHGRILVQDHVKYDFWTIPVGKVKHDETVEEGLLTEMREELNIKPTKYYEMFTTKKTYDREGIPVTVTQHVFFIVSYEGTVRNNEPDKHRSIKWMSIDEIRKQTKLSDATINYLEYIGKKNPERFLDKELVPVYVLLTYTNSTMAKAIKFVTHQPYSHAGISLDSSMQSIFTYGRKESKDKCKFTVESIFDGLLGTVKDSTPYSLYVTFFEKYQFETLKQRISTIKDDIRRHGYSYKGLVNFALGRETHDDYRMFCSQFVADVIKAGDPSRVKKHASKYSPSDLSKVKGMHFVTKGILGNYDQKKVDTAVEKLKRSLTPNNIANPMIESTINESLENEAQNITVCVNCKSPIGYDYIQDPEKACANCGELYHTEKEKDTICQLYESSNMFDFVSAIQNTDDIERLRACLESVDRPEYVSKLRNRINALENASYVEKEKCLYIIIESTDTRLVNNHLNIFNISDTDTTIYTVEECKEGANVSFNVDKYRRKGLKLVKEECENELPAMESGKVQVSYKITSEDQCIIESICENFTDVKAWKPMAPMTSLNLKDTVLMESYGEDMLRSINIDTGAVEIKRFR